MKDLLESVKKWVVALNNGKLDEITSELKNVQPGSHTDKYIFKILLLLSHFTDRCIKENLSQETEIWNLSRSICSILQTIPNKDKFFSSIYFITRYLIQKGMYTEAMHICENLLSGKFIKKDDRYCCEKYLQLAYVWYTCGARVQLELVENPDSKNTKQFFEIVKYHFHVLSNTRNHIKVTFDAVNSYTKRLTNIPLKILLSHLKKFMRVLRDHLVDLQIPWKEEDYVELYKRFIDITDHSITCKIKTGDMSLLSVVFKHISDLFLLLFQANTAWYECFVQYSRFYIALLQPLDVYEPAGQQIGKCVYRFGKAIEKYGYRNGAIWETIVGSNNVLEQILCHWESCLVVEENYTSVSFLMLHTVKFILHINQVLERIRPSVGCKYCVSENCPMQIDLGSAVNLKLKCLKVICKLPVKNVSKELYALTTDFLLSSVEAIDELKKMGCKRWASLWSNCGRHLFNFGICSEKICPEECEKLYTLLCLKTVEFEGMTCKESNFGLDNPVCTILHRLCHTKYSQNKFREAMTITAYNGLFSYANPKTKAFTMWAHIKKKCEAMQNIQSLSMVACLQADTEDVKELGIIVDFEKYDLREICLQEIKALQEIKSDSVAAIKAALKELTSMKNHNLQFAQGVQLMSCHLLHFQEMDQLLSYIETALKKLSAEPQTIRIQCLAANLEFYAFVSKLYEKSKIIEKEMDDAKFVLRSSGELGDIELEANEVTASYGAININGDKKLAVELKNIIEKWEDCIEENISELLDSWELNITLESIILSGEYARLYRLQGCEKELWKLAYALASSLNNWAACTYITARSISLRYIVDEWIRQADVCTNTLKASSDNYHTTVLALYWLSLADFYFDSGMLEEARELLKDLKDLPQEISMLNNSHIYVYSVDIKFRNYHLLSEELKQAEYSNFIVQIHYGMITLNDYVKNFKVYWKSHDIILQFLGYNILFEITDNICQSMNSLLSFREISAHLLQRLKLAQRLGATQQVALCLKNLCYIDISRHRLDVCEANLQDLEHILGIENFRESMMMDNRDFTDSTQDRLRNGASPVLRRKAFASPECTHHGDKCQCYQCNNVWYLYLIFASTSIRAQLYALRKLPAEALQHFNGCITIYKRICDREVSLLENKRFSWRRAQSASVDYALYLLGFGLFAIEVKPPRKDEAVSIVQQAITFCEESNLTIHPVYTMAKEIFFQMWFYESFTDYSAFTVPDISSIQIEVTKEPVENCITPRHEIRPKESYSVRRRKSPPLIQIPKVPVQPIEKKTENSSNENLSSDDDKKVGRPVRNKPVRRKILDEYSEGRLSSSENVTKGPISRESYSLRRRKSPPQPPKIEVQLPSDKKEVCISDDDLSSDEDKKGTRTGRNKSVRRKILDEYIGGQASATTNAPKDQNTNIKSSIKEPSTRSRKVSLPKEVKESVLIEPVLRMSRRIRKSSNA